MSSYISEKTDSSVASTPIVDHASYAPELHTPEHSDKERFMQIKGSRFWEPTTRPSVPSLSASSHDRMQQEASRPRKTVLWLSVLLVLSIVLSVAIGGAVGITTTQNLQAEITQLRIELASRQGDGTASLATTATNSSSCPAAAPTIASTCTDQFYQVKSTCDIYQRYCDTNFAAIIQYSYMFNTTAPDLRSCIEICDTYNYALRSRDDGTQTNMTAVVWGSAKSNDTQILYPGSCFCAHANEGANLTTVPGVQMAIRLPWNRQTC